MFNIPNSTLTISYKCCDLRFENGQVDSQGIGGNCTRFYTCGIQVRTVFKYSLKTERRQETSRHIAAVHIFPLLSLYEMKDSRSVCESYHPLPLSFV